MIVSGQNRKIKDMRRLLRCKGDHAVLEGPHLVAAALAAGLPLEDVLATPEFLATEHGQRLAQRLADQVTQVAARLLEKICDTDSPRGILAVARLPRSGVGALPIHVDGLYLFVDGFQDPGNLGALARAGEAFAVTAMALTPGTVHPNHPRALRASAGSLLRLPLATDVTVAQLCNHLQPLAPRWLALDPGSDRSESPNPVGCIVLAVGAEGPGLSPEVIRQADLRWTIPVEPPVDSLNATVAAAIALYEMARGRRPRQS